MATDLFISCAEEDLTTAKIIKKSMFSAGFSCWLYTDNAPGGISHHTTQADAIGSCKALILLVSKHSVTSKEVTMELVFACDKNIHIIPVLIDISWEQIENNWKLILGGITSLIWSNNGKPSRTGFNKKLQNCLHSLKIFPSHSFVKNKPSDSEKKPENNPEQPGNVMNGSKSEYKPTREEPRYGIFVHYDLKVSEALPDKRDIFIDRMIKRLKFLSDILKPSGPGDWQGRAFIFVDMGWSEILKDEINPHQAVEIADWIGVLKGRIKDMDDSIKLVGIRELLKFQQSLTSGVAEETRNILIRYLAGGEGPMRYDAPKVIEGFIRIANIGHHAPIFRFDDDVIFSDADTEGSARQTAIKQFKINIARLLTHFEQINRKPDVGYFMFSGHYSAQKADPIDSMINSHATRVLQLCKFNPTVHETSLTGLFKNVPKIPVELDMPAAKKFLSEMAKFGASTERQVVSGAGLCLSDGAILDLPPFSNMRQNVIWIDDHLKYALHHELRHFGYNFGTRQRARVPDAVFSQKRYVNDGRQEPVFTLSDVAWHLQVYMPRLVLGCIADAFLRADKNLKGSFSTTESFNDAMEKVPSVYGRTLAQHQGGCIDIKNRQKLGNELWAIAQKRLDELVEFFSGFEGTFLKAWTDGTLGQSTHYVPMAMPSFRQSVKNFGASPCFTNTGTELKEDLRTSIAVLIEDFLDYIEYTHAWREIVYTVRTLITRSRLPGEQPLPFQLT